MRTVNDGIEISIPDELAARVATASAEDMSNDIHTPTQTRLYPLSDAGNAERFIERNRHLVRFCVPWDEWVLWDGKRWQKDTGRRAVQVAIETARTIMPLEYDAYRLHVLETATSEKEEIRLLKQFERFALNCEDRTPIKNTLEIASTDPSVHVMPDDFDAYPHLLCVQNGVLDMDTGQLHPHDRSFGCSRMVSVDFDPLAECPTWLEFLKAVQSPAKIEYLQRMAGYGFSGFTNEQKAWFHLGTGANGKGTFKDTLAALAADYAAAANFKTFMASNSDSAEKPRPDVARLQGARLILTSEVEKGKRLSEAFFKQFTGEDKITARSLHENDFEFQPRGKVWLLCNHLPQISGTDFGIWRRIERVNWDIEIPIAARDTTLRNRLLCELPGILRWVYEGYQKWRADGLKTPDEILEANNEYRTSQDWLSSFTSECITMLEERNPPAFVSYDLMHRRYKTWAEAGDEEFSLSLRKFNTALRERKFVEGRNTAGDQRGWLHVELTPN